MMRPNRKTFVAMTGFLIALAIGLTITYFYRSQQIAPTINDDGTLGLRFRLSEGVSENAPAEAVTRAESVKLSDADTKRVLDRLPTFTADPTEATDFALRDKSLPPPLVGETIKTTFPAIKQPDAVNVDANQPLKVLRSAPNGEVDQAANITITFSQPMVSVSSIDDVIAENLPIKMTPNVAGRWRWLGTTTLVFEPKDKLPMATQYELIVPAGTKSALGKELAQAYKWSFSTPPPQIKLSYPDGESQPRDPLFFIGFDQKIDAKEMIKSIQVSSAKSNQNWSLKLIDASAVKADKEMSNIVAAAEAGYWLAFRAVSPTQGLPPFPGAETFNVKVLKNAPSAEGSRRTDKEQQFTFTTYGKFAVHHQDCDSASYPCPTTYPINITFTNPVDGENFKSELVSIEPPIKNANINLYGQALSIIGTMRAKTTYQVKLNKELKDIYGQTLESDKTLKFYFGDAEKKLSGPGQAMVVIDNYGPPRLPIFSTSHRSLTVRIYRVVPGDFSAYLKYLSQYGYGQDVIYLNSNKQKMPIPPGQLIDKREVIVNGSVDQLSETGIDLSPALVNGLGQMIVEVEPTDQANGVYENEYRRYLVRRWVQVTNIGLTAIMTDNRLLSWATSLRDGRPLNGVEFSIIGGPTNRGDNNGLASLPLGGSLKQNGVLVARQGNDTALLPENIYYYGDSGWQIQKAGAELYWHVFDDRHLYRPSETVKIKGWIRRFNPNNHQLSLIDGTNTINYQLYDSQGNKVLSGTAPVNVLGGFDTSLTLPPNINLGAAHLQLEIVGSSISKNTPGATQIHYFNVEEFRRPEFEVTAKAGEGPHLIGQHANVNVAASYYAGGGLTGTEVKWTVTAGPGYFTPPNRSDFTFGQFNSYWYQRSNNRRDGQPEQPATQNYTGRTDSAGQHNLRIDFDSVNPSFASSITAQATVIDVNRQAHSATANLLVHPASIYVGLRTPRAFIQEHQPLTIDAIVTDLDGKAVAKREVKLSIERVKWSYIAGEQQEQVQLVREVTIDSGNEPVSFTLDNPVGGSYRITAIVQDEQQRRNASEMMVWVAGEKLQPERSLKLESVKLIPARPQYQPGETAEILMIAPFYPAEALMLIQQNGSTRTERFSLNESTYTIKLPINEKDIPNINLKVELVGSAQRASDNSDEVIAANVENDGKIGEVASNKNDGNGSESNKNKPVNGSNNNGSNQQNSANNAGQSDGSNYQAISLRPAFASGQLNISIPAKLRELKVTAKARNAELSPGEQTVVDIDLRDAKGQPINGGEVAVIVVDESVLALGGHKFTNPLDIFYGERVESTSHYHSRTYVQLASENDLADKQSGKMVVKNNNAKNGKAEKVANLRSSEGRLGGGSGGGVLETKKQISQPALAPMPEASMMARSDKASELDDGVVGGVVGGGDFAKEMNAVPPPPPPPPAQAMPANAKMPAGQVLRQFERGGLPSDIGSPDTNETGVVTPIRARTNFNAMAIFVPSLPTDANGHAQVEVKLPDNLTRYRVVAVAVSGSDKYGLGESTITARLPLMVRPSAPRFLNFGDRFELPIVVHNQTDQAMQIDLAVRTANAELTDGAGRRFTVPARQRREVVIPAATVRAGTARFQIGGIAGNLADAAEVELPVWTPATTEAFATYGEVADGAIMQPVKAPNNIFPQFGGLEVTTSSTQLQSLTDAVIYLDSYPFECSEQISSRLITITALKDVLSAFHAKGLPKSEAMLARVNKDIKRLKDLQNYDGGFDFWKRGEPSYPYVSIHVAHALQRAKEKGFNVPPEMLSSLNSYLSNFEYSLPEWYTEEVRRTLVAYALYVRNRMGYPDQSRARSLAAEGIEKLPLEALGWLLPLLAKDPASESYVQAIHTRLNNSVSETAAGAHFVNSYRSGGHLLLASERRADGAILEALINTKPDSDLIPKLVRGLLGERKQGHWGNTQDNVFVLLALDRYFAVFEKATPNFVAQTWLGNQYAGEHAFKGRTTEQHQIDIPMKFIVAQAAAQNLIINKNGAGRLYYRIGLQYAPTDLKLPAADNGFTVERIYEAIDNADDVKRNADGSWQIKAGARVRVRLTIMAQAERHHIALVDPLPAGLEVLNTRLATTESLPPDTNTNGDIESKMINRRGNVLRGGMDWYWRYWGSYFNHENIRDNRLEAFATYLNEGVHKYTYVARATTPGNFVVPATKAEEMYHPETFGRTATDRVIIK